MSLVALAGCNEDPSYLVAPRGPAPGIMSAVVDGATWSAGGISGSPATAAYASGTLTVVGRRFYLNGSGDYISIVVHSFSGVGTVPLSLESSATSGAAATWANYATGQDTTTFATDAAHTGSLTVTRFDTARRNVQGTFTFTGYHAPSSMATSVTGGTFDVWF